MLKRALYQVMQDESSVEAFVDVDGFSLLRGGGGHTAPNGSV